MRDKVEQSFLSKENNLMARLMYQNPTELKSELLLTQLSHQTLKHKEVFIRKVRSCALMRIIECRERKRSPFIAKRIILCCKKH